ncbi:MAG TPA: hypothetical protein VMJ66_11490 [Geobacteraceae bacterium]|nr:hypothetical protein [Geobacteraceae bacterium]
MTTDYLDRSDMKWLRLLPLNLIASLKLRQASVVERDYVLPVFQLMEWGLASGMPLTHHRTAGELLRLSHQLDQRAAVDYLLNNVPGGLKGLSRNLLHLRPRPAAQLLLDVLDMRLKADPRNRYPAGL